MNDKVHIILASDANYLPGLEVTQASILRSCRTPERIAWHVFGEKDLETLDVSAFAAWNCGSKMTCLRLFLPELPVSSTVMLTSSGKGMPANSESGPLQAVSLTPSGGFGISGVRRRMRTTAVPAWNDMPSA